MELESTNETSSLKEIDPDNVNSADIEKDF